MLMQPGFEAESGSAYVARIEDCPDQLQEEETGEEFFFQTTLHQEAQEDKLGISVFPNPTRHQVTIQLHDFEEGELQLLDATGKVLLTETIFTTSQVDMHSFYPGIFFLQVRERHSGKVFTHKVVKW